MVSDDMRMSHKLYISSSHELCTWKMRHTISYSEKFLYYQIAPPENLRGCCLVLLHVLMQTCNTLEHTGTLCNTLQHSATHCNTLQHTATLCNTHVLMQTCMGHVPHMKEPYHTYEGVYLYLYAFLWRDTSIPASIHLYPHRYSYTHIYTVIPASIQSYPHLYSYTRIYTYIPASIQSYPHLYLHTRIYTSLPTSTHLYPHVYLCILCTYASMHAMQHHQHTPMPPCTSSTHT